MGVHSYDILVVYIFFACVKRDIQVRYSGCNNFLCINGVRYCIDIIFIDMNEYNSDIIFLYVSMGQV